METAKIVTFAKYGAPLVLSAFKSPELMPKQLLIKVYSVSLNPIDYKRLKGHTTMLIKDHFPAGVCFDVAGVVEKVGADLTNFAVGQRVCARSKVSGVLADYCVLDESVTSAMPDNVSFNDAAALPLAGQTALQSLRTANLKEGETVLISGGAGGVGSYAVQLAKHVFKASKVVTTCSGGKVEFCKSLGADECIDYTKGDPFDAQKLGAFDVVFDTTGEARHMGGGLIKPGRLIVSVAAMPDPGSFERADLPIGFFLKSMLSLVSIRERWNASPGIYNYVLLKANSKDLTELVGYLSEGKIRSCIDSVFDGLEKASDAFAKIESGRAKGKVIVVVARDSS